MKKNNVDIETLFQSKFRTAEIKPRPDLWTKINSKLEVKRKIQFFKKLTFGISLIIISIVIVNLALVSKKNIQKNKPIIVSKANKLSFNKKKLPNIAIPSKVRKTYLKDKKQNQEHRKPTQNVLIKKLAELKPKENTKEIVASTIIDSFNRKDKKMVNLAMAKIAINQKRGCEPLKVEINIENKNNTIFFIDFGDGENVYGRKVNHEYVKAGTYVVRVKRKLKVLVTDTIIVFPKPVFSSVINLKNNYYEGEKIDLKTELLPDEKCRWNVGNISSLGKKADIPLQKEGIYPVSIVKWTDKSCKDSFFLSSINVIPQNYQVQFPNAFRPNINGEPDEHFSSDIRNNQIFYPLLEGVEKISLKIYNRNGALVFETQDPTVGWNGYFKHHLMPEDVYIWKASGIYLNGDEFTLAGNLTLIY